MSERIARINRRLRGEMEPATCDTSATSGGRVVFVANVRVTSGRMTRLPPELERAIFDDLDSLYVS